MNLEKIVISFVIAIPIVVSLWFTGRTTGSFILDSLLIVISIFLLLIYIPFQLWKLRSHVSKHAKLNKIQVILVTLILLSQLIIFFIFFLNNGLPRF